jgi:putative peptidoglycan lipid II flippase
MMYLDLGHVGLALATSVAAYLNAGLLWRGLRREGVYRFDPAWRVFLPRLLAATAVMIGLVLWLSPTAPAWLAWGWQHRALQLALLVAVGGGAYLAVLIAAGLRLRDLRSPP